MKEWEKLESIYNMNLQTRTRKQRKMHMTVFYCKTSSKSKKLQSFYKAFSYDTFYFATLDNEPITVEKIIDGEFKKYVNNNGNPCQKVLGKRDFGAFFQ